MNYSLQDLIALFLPHMAGTAGLLILVAFVYDPTMTLLLYSVLPESCKTWPWFLACLMEEARLITVIVAVGIPMLQVQVVAFDLANATLEAAVPNTLQR